MTRVIPRKTHHRKIIALAKGYWGRRKNTFRAAQQAVERAGQYAYRDRRKRKSDLRSLWIQRINAAARLENMTYGRFINGLNRSNIKVNRKMLAEMAVRSPDDFKSLVEKAKAALS